METNAKNLMIEAFMELDNELVVKYFDLLETKTGGRWTRDWMTMIHEHMCDRLVELIDSGKIEVSSVNSEEDAHLRLTQILSEDIDND